MEPGYVPQGAPPPEVAGMGYPPQAPPPDAPPPGGWQGHPYYPSGHDVDVRDVYPDLAEHTSIRPHSGLSPQERAQLDQYAQSIQESLAALQNGGASHAGAQHTSAVLGHVQQQEAHMASIMQSHGFPVPPPVDLSQNPYAHQPGMEDMVLQHSLSRVEDNMYQMQGQLRQYDETGQVVVDQYGHVPGGYAGAPYQDTLPPSPPQHMPPMAPSTVAAAVPLLPPPTGDGFQPVMMPPPLPMPVPLMGPLPPPPATAMWDPDGAPPAPAMRDMSDVAAYMQQYEGMSEEEEKQETTNYEEYRPSRKFNLRGVTLNILYILACLFYSYVRIRYTIAPLGRSMAYGVIILLVEWLGMLSVILFSTTLLFKPRLETWEDKDNYKHEYHIRVMIPCYKESLSIVKQTILAAHQATTPKGCRKTIYLCDDGKDVAKREWVLSSNDPDLVYVTGRKRKKGEANGKSNNLNNCLKLIYPRGVAIGLGEVMCLFDADQVCSQDFFVKMLPLIDSGDNVAIALSPQCVYNVMPGQDIFNRSNVQFWEVMLPGYDALGFISCTGTNMLIRCKALQQVGWFPNNTVTEDWELGMMMKKNRWYCRYRQEYLAVGEAPLEVRNAFQQRSRWCKGHFQTFFSRSCPAIDRNLSVGMRLLYSGSVISYISTAISVPLMTLVPVIAIFWGIFPVALGFWAVLGITVFYVITSVVLFQANTFKRLMALWFVQVSNSILWWTFMKAAFLTPIKMMLGRDLSFKVTKKGSSSGFSLRNIPWRDLTVPTLFTLLSLLAFILGVANIDVNTNAAQILSTFWALWNTIPGLLLLSYTIVGQGRVMRVVCLIMFVLSFALSATAIIMVWFYYPRDVDYFEIVERSMQFIGYQKSGTLHDANRVLWRLPTLTDLQVGVRFEGETEDTLFSLEGGFYSGGLGGNSKIVSNIAFSTAMLSWGALSFWDGFKTEESRELAMQHINDGAVYLMRSHVWNATVPRETVFFPYAGNLEYEFESWERPEDLDERMTTLWNEGRFEDFRNVYPVPNFTPQDTNLSNINFNQNNPGQLLFAGVGDIASQMSAALTAAGMVLVQNVLLRNNGQRFISRGAELYALAKLYPGRYTNLPQFKEPLEELNLASSSYRDDLFWAAAWQYKANAEADTWTTGEAEELLKEVEDLYKEAAWEVRNSGEESGYGNIDKMTAFATVLMATSSESEIFVNEVKNYLKPYLCQDRPIKQSKRGRMWHPNAPTLGDTATVAFMMAQYAKLGGFGRSKTEKLTYMCKAVGQLRYFYGDNRGDGFIVGVGPRAPKRTQHAGATCSPYPSNCPPIEKLSFGEDKNILYGALVEGPSGPEDDYDTRRDQDGARVSLVANAALPGLAAAATDTNIYWMECLQGDGVFSRHPICK